jgi:hypothetical protein
MNRNLFAALWVAILLLCAGYAWGHATNHPQHHLYTEEEYVWIKRQRSVDGRWCCGPENIFIVEDPHLRVRGGRYEVHLLNQWVPVPANSMHRYNADDPSPFPGEVLLFFSTDGQGSVTVWCLTSPTGG